MKRFLLVLIAILFAIQGFSQTTLNESFEGATFPPDYWRIENTSGRSYWVAHPWNSHTGEKNAYSQIYFNDEESTKWLITPKLLVSPTANNFAFWLKTEGMMFGHMDNFNLDVLVSTTNSDPNSFVSASLLSLVGSMSEPWGWNQHNIDLSAYVGQEIYVAIRTISSGDMVSLFIDDVTGPEIVAPSFPKPTLLNVSNPTISGIDLEWTDATGSLWNIQYMLASETDWANATTISGITSHPYTFTQLNSSKKYKARIQTDNGLAVSDWSSIITFLTNCAPISTFPYREDFSVYMESSNISFPPCWSKNLSNGNPNYPNITPDRENHPGLMFFWSPTDQRRAAVCNQIDPTIPINTLTVKFNMMNDYQLDGNGIQVGILTDPNDYSTFVSVGGRQLLSAIDVWEDKIVDLSNYTGTGTYIALAAIASSSQQATAYVQHFEVDYTYPTPRTLASSPSFTTSTLTWTAGRDETAWQIKQGLTGTAADITATTYQATGLTPDTDYTYYVRSKYGEDLYSNWVEVSFTTLPIPINQLPFICDFEDAADNDKWTLHNATQTNKWYIGAAGAKESGNGLFISDNGTTANYNIISRSIVMASTLVEFDDSPIYDFSFDWKAVGEGQWDRLNVYVIPNEVAIVPGSRPLDIYKVTPTDLSGSSTWQNKVIYLGSQYSNSIRQVVFVWENDNNVGYQPPATIDNVKVIGITCAIPSNLVVNSTNSTSVDLSWTENGNASEWRVKYSKDNGTTWETQTATTNTNFILTGLDHTTSYIVSLNALCSLTDSSTYITTTFTTDCPPLAQLPWKEGFEGITQDNELPNCWTATNLGSKTFIHVLDPSEYFLAKSGTKVGRFFNDCNDKFTSPSFELLAGNNYAFTFWYITDGYNGWNNLQARVRNINDLSINQIIGTPVINPTNEAHKQYIGYFTPTADGDYKFDIECLSGYNANYLLIDDIELSSNNCTMPENLTLSNITETSADLSWDEMGSASEWRVKYSNDGVTWQTQTATTNTNFIITGLIQASTYLIEVYSLCSPEDSSFAITSTFHTSCVTVNQFPFKEGFEGGFACWQQEYVNGTLDWTSSSQNNQAHTGTGLANFYYGGVGKITKLISPMLDISGLSNPYISFWHMQEIWSGDQDKLEVLYRASNSDSWTQLVHYNESIEAYRLDSILLPNPSSTYQIAFEGAAYFGYGVALDDITVYDLTPSPTNLAAMPSFTTSTLTWTAGRDETAWQVRQGETGAEIGITEIGYQATGLTPNTSYTYYIRSKYGEDLYSNWVEVPFTTLTIIPPTVLANPVTNITQTTATLNATITEGSEAIISQGFEWRIASESLWTNITSILTEDAITHNLTGLTADEYYYFRAFATTATETTYGDYELFTTLEIVPPNVQANPVTNITQTTVTLNATITEGSEAIISQGFEWKLASESLWTTITSILTEDAITHNLTGLTANTDYNFRAFATTATETTYGFNENFTTLDIVPPIVEANPVTNITQTTATLNATITQGSEAVISQGFIWKLASESQWITLNADLIGGLITSDLTGLIPYSDYYFIPFATTATETTYGDYELFTTLEIVPPTVITNDATDITTTLASLNSTISLGSEDITSQGFEWKLETENTWNITTSNLLTGLLPYSDYEFRAFAITASGTTYGYIESFKTLPALPVVVTNQATLITQTTATLNATITEGSEDIISQGFEYRLITGVWIIAETNLLTGLTPNTDYEFRAFVTTASDITYGQAIDFTTLEIVAPTAQTLAATQITQTTATLNGAIIQGSETITAQGYEVRLATETAWNIAASNSLTGLTPYTYYEFRAYVTTASGTIYGEIEDFETLPTPPVVVTTAVTNLTQISATLNGTLTVNSESITTQGFEYRQQGEGTWTSITESTLTHDLGGLTPYTNYEYRAYAITLSGIVYGQAITFKTLPTPQIVVTNPATTITQTTATLNSTITANSEAITSQGYELRLASATTWAKTTSNNLTGLTPYTNYEFRAYAITVSDTVYGQAITFKTLPTPQIVVTNPATTITQTTATLNSEITQGSEAITSQGYEMRLASSTTWAKTTSNNLTGLTPYTNYEFRAYAITVSDTVYGQAITFKTLPTPQIVITNLATTITQTTATLNSTITANSEAITSQGYELRLASANTWTKTTSNNLTGLTPYTNYEFRAYAITVSDTVYGLALTFKTLPTPQIVITNLATTITQTTATLNSEITQGSEAITSQGYEMRLASATTWAKTTSNNLTGLTPYTNYEFRAYSTTVSDTVYGQALNFKTLATPPTVVTNASTLITQVAATLNGTITIGSEAISSQGLDWRELGNTTWTNLPLTGTTLTRRITGLTPYADYEYRAYATTLSGTIYGETQIFTTLEIVPPTVLASFATSLTQTTASINGSIGLGSEVILAQGFSWKQANSNTWTIVAKTVGAESISHNLINLIANTIYEFKTYARTESGTIYSDIQTFTTLDIVAPTVTTSNPTSIAETTATLNGIIEAGSETITEKGFELRLLNANTWTKIAIPIVSNTITHNLIALDPNSEYEYRAYAKTVSGTIYGTVQSFTTLPILSIAITNPATSITQNLATLNGIITQGSEIIISQGFEWRELGLSTWTNITLTDNLLVHNLTGLSPNTDYEYRVYVAASSGTVYGDIKTFTTLQIVPPAILTSPATLISQTYATINGAITIGSEVITAQGFEYRLGTANTWTPINTIMINNAINHNLTGLTVNTDYEFRAYVSTESGTVYGDVQSFTTLPIVPPTVITSASTLVGQTYATLNGTITLGSETITTQGFEWREEGESTWTSLTLVDNAMTHNLTGITPFTVYQYRAYATTEEGSVYGQIQNFRTLPIAPVALTSPVANLTQVRTTLNGVITPGSEAIIAQGFEWRKAGINTWTNIILTDSQLTYNLEGLIANTDYQYRAYASTESGTVYGIAQNFTTLQIVPPTVVTLVATEVEQTAATLNGTIEQGSELLISQGFEWKLSSATAWIQEITNLTSNTIAHNLNSITPNRLYQYRAYAITEDGITYGTVLNFTTPPIPAIAITTPATSITETMATLNGNLVSGSELIVTQGFEWRKTGLNTWTDISSPFTATIIYHTLLGLEPNTTYEYRAHATTASGTVYGQVQNFTTLALPQTVVTNSATAITSTLATLNGTVTAGSETLTAQGFEWKLVNASTWTTISSTLTGNAISHNLTSLIPNTTYAYRAYATNASGTVYGQTQNFTTLAVPPTVVTSLATAITQNVATLNAAITAGSETITAQGFEFKLANANTWTPITVIPTSNPLTYNLTGLTPNTAYTFRAYATTDLGTVYGITQTFTTLAIVPPTVVTSLASAITQNVATLNGTITAGSETIITQGFEWKLANANTWTPITVIPTSSAITHNLTGLTPNTAYTYRAYATTNAGEVYGITQTFTTLAIVPPTVVTSVATAITQTVATLNGTITEGTYQITTQGFEFRISNTNTWTTVTVFPTSNAISHNLVGLTPNTSYEYRAYAVIEAGRVYGITQTFTTLQIVPPTVVTNSATAITENNATLNAAITAGSEVLISQGFEFRPSNTNTWTVVAENLIGNLISHNLTGLLPSTVYEFRAYATTSIGIVYGTSQTFTTLGLTPPAVLTNAPTSITETVATLNGTITAGTDLITSQGFEWRVSNAIIWMPVNATGSSINHNLTGLNPNTTYEFRAYATTSKGTVYGATINFTTIAIIPPTVITNPATPITSTSATLNGTITLGSQQIITQGFEWKEAGANDWTVVLGTLNGETLTYNLTGLSPNRSYRFRAGVVTTTGIIYGETMNFTTLGLNGLEVGDISIKMYPNPARVQTKLIVSGISGDVKLIISDVQGRVLRTINTKATNGVLEQTIDLNELVEGVYYIRVQNSDINQTQKLIVK